MKALSCPNCGGKQFEELTGKRQCIYCGAEFEVNMVVKRYRTAPHYYIRRETVGGTFHPIPYWGTWNFPRIKRSHPGITAGNFQLELGQTFLPMIRNLVNLLRGTS